jgi:hypothetical protein
MVAMNGDISSLYFAGSRALLIISYLPKRAYGKHSLRGSILAQRLYLRLFGDQEIHIFGLVLWKQRSFSFHMVLSL